MDQEPKTLQGQKLAKTVTLYDSLQSYYFQKPYHLRDKEFYILTKSANKLETISFAFFTASAFALIGVFTKLLTEQSIKSWEYIAPLLATILGVALYGLGRALPNEKRTLIKNIERHFKENPSLSASMDIDNVPD